VRYLALECLQWCLSLSIDLGVRQGVIRHPSISVRIHFQRKLDVDTLAGTVCQHSAKDLTSPQEPLSPQQTRAVRRLKLPDDWRTYLGTTTQLIILSFLHVGLHAYQTLLILYSFSL